LRKNRVNIRPFRIMAVFLAVVVLMMISRFPAKSVGLEREQKMLELKAKEYYELQSEYNRLHAELAEINTADFVERTARREYEYCWYGEIIYEIGNLDEIVEKAEFEIYEENYSDT